MKATESVIKTPQQQYVMTLNTHKYDESGMKQCYSSTT